MTTQQKPGCECTINDDMAWAGPGIRLCHHSSTREAEEVQERIAGLLATFAQNLDHGTMLDKTLKEMAEEYRREASGMNPNLLNRDERLIININFLRNLSLAAQMFMCAMIIERNGEAG